MKRFYWILIIGILPLLIAMMTRIFWYSGLMWGVAYVILEILYVKDILLSKGPEVEGYSMGERIFEIVSLVSISLIGGFIVWKFFGVSVDGIFLPYTFYLYGMAFISTSISDYRENKKV